MVYCGVPSKACGTCRAKRTRCDLASPICGQCRRARRPCPGYRNANDLVFRNETNNVVNKAQASSFAALNVVHRESSPLPPDNAYWKVKTLDSSEKNAIVAKVSPAVYDELIPRRLGLSVEDQGSSFFFYNFVIEDSPFPASYSAFMPTLYNNVTALGPGANPLPGIITAIGMAGISNLQGSAAAMVATRQKYTKVLHTLNSALQDPRTATDDSTLMAVILLGLFETVTGANPQSLKSWSSHIKGATAISQARGRDQVKNDIGWQIFSHLRNHIVVDCFQRRRAMPPYIIEWTDLAEEHNPSQAIQRGNQLFRIVARLCALLYQPDKDIQEKDDPNILTLLKDIDADLADYESNFTGWARYTTKQCKISEHTLLDYYHCYCNTWIVSSYNMYRSARILTHETMLAYFSRNPTWDSLNIQHRESETILTKMSDEICASVPFILGGVDPENPEKRIPRAAAGTALVWPLYLAATMDLAKASTRAWVITRLDKLGHTMGIQLAVSLAQVLREKKFITAWDRFESTPMNEELDDW